MKKRCSNISFVFLLIYVVNLSYIWKFKTCFKTPKWNLLEEWPRDPGLTNTPHSSQSIFFVVVVVVFAMYGDYYCRMLESRGSSSSVAYCTVKEKKKRRFSPSWAYSEKGTMRLSIWMEIKLKRKWRWPC